MEQPRVSIVTCVSTALDLLQFSSKHILERAGEGNFDYFIVCWLTSKEVDDYILHLRRLYEDDPSGIRIYRMNYQTRDDVGYVPNLRGMMNLGFYEAAYWNPYLGLVNTDMAFCHDWLKKLRMHIQPNRVVAAVPIEPVGCAWYSQDFGCTTEGDFRLAEFDAFCDKMSTGRLIREHELEFWHRATAMPWLIHRDAWEAAGPWDLECSGGPYTPDVEFFTRIHDRGFEFCAVGDCICYHVGYVERLRRPRPPGAEGLANE